MPFMFHLSVGGPNIDSVLLEKQWIADVARIVLVEAFGILLPWILAFAMVVQIERNFSLLSPQCLVWNQLEEQVVLVLVLGPGI